MKSLVIATLAGAAALFSVSTSNISVAHAEELSSGSSYCVRTVCRGYGYDRTCWKVNTCRRSYY